MAAMEIRDTPALCTVGEGVRACDVPAFSLHRSSVSYQPGNPLVRYAGTPSWMSPVPKTETWKFIQGKLDTGAGRLEPVWVREE